MSDWRFLFITEGQVIEQLTNPKQSFYVIFKRSVSHTWKKKHFYS